MQISPPSSHRFYNNFGQPHFKPTSDYIQETHRIARTKANMVSEATISYIDHPNPKPISCCSNIFNNPNKYPASCSHDNYDMYLSPHHKKSATDWRNSLANKSPRSRPHLTPAKFFLQPHSSFKSKGYQRRPIRYQDFSPVLWLRGNLKLGRG
jgi:hypothetical protein